MNGLAQKGYLPRLSVLQQEAMGCISESTAVKGQPVIAEQTSPTRALWSFWKMHKSTPLKSQHFGPCFLERPTSQEKIKSTMYKWNAFSLVSNLFSLILPPSANTRESGIKIVKRKKWKTTTISPHSDCSLIKIKAIEKVNTRLMWVWIFQLH